MLRVCQAVDPVRVSAGQTVYEQGKIGAPPLALAPLPLIRSYKPEKSLCGTGSEMYFVLSGELEVICDGDRLGFLGQGAVLSVSLFLSLFLSLCLSLTLSFCLSLTLFLSVSLICDGDWLGLLG